MAMIDFLENLNPEHGSAKECLGCILNLKNIGGYVCFLHFKILIQSVLTLYKKLEGN